MFIDLALCFFRAYALSQFAQHFASNSHGPKAFSPVPLRTHDAPVSERDRQALGEICLSGSGNSWLYPGQGGRQGFSPRLYSHLKSVHPNPVLLLFSQGLQATVYKGLQAV